MRYLFTLLLFSSFTFAATTSELAVLKSKNYKFMSQTYTQLKTLLSQNKVEQFCDQVDMMGQTLYKIFDADMEFVSSLREHDNDDFYDYSLHISENAYTDLFTFNMFSSRCNAGTARLSLASFTGVKINLNYLINSHRLWMNAYCPMLPGKCLK